MEDKFTNIKERVLQFANNKGVSYETFFSRIGMSYGNFKGKSKKTPLNSKAIEDIFTIYPDLNLEWLLTGEGQMLKGEQKEENKKLIPLYDDVATIGGSDISADVSGVSRATEYIDAGDWFSDVTAAIRHYGTSMSEYPNGCILALRKLNNHRSIVWGRNYVVETNETRVTKRLQTCPEDDTCIMAYSTNTETYPDGRLVHEPFKIYKEDIRHIFLIIGRVVKEHSSAPVYTVQK